MGGALQPYIIQNIIDNALLKNNVTTLYMLVAISFALAIFSIMIKSINEIYYTKFSMNILFTLREQILNKIFFHHKTFLNKFHSADLLSRIQGDVSEVQRFFTDSFLALFSTVISLVIISTIVYSYNIQLMILILIFLPLEFFCLKPLYKYMHGSTKDLREKTSHTSKFFIETLRYLTVLKTLGAKDHTLMRLNGVHDSYQESVINNKKLNLVFTQIPALISLIGKTLLLLYGGYLTIQGELQVGELVAFLTYFTMILSPVHTLLGIMNNVPKVKVSINRINEVLPLSMQPVSILNEEHFDLKVVDLSFSYGDKKVFENINLEIKERQKIALIGKNGIGKSTLGELLSAIEKPSQGDILIGSSSIVHTNISNIECYVVKMEQTPIIFEGTLRENLRVANLKASEDQMLKALKATGMFEWFHSLDEGFDTNLIESGGNLSVGQRQRIVMARILLLKPKIVILDEFTSSIDHEDKQWFLLNIHTLFKESTVIVITHEMDMLRHLDAVYEVTPKSLKKVELK